jgi:hypothetical protein
MKLLTYCNKLDRELPQLLRSIDGKLPYECHIISGDFTWQKVIDWQREVAQKHKNETIFLVDAYDTLFVGDAEELEYHAVDRGLTFCGSKKCWPDESKKAKYDHLFPWTVGYKWRYLNGSVMCGKGQEILEAIDWGNHFVPIHPHVDDGRLIYHQDNDQRFWTDIHFNRVGQIDLKCDIFQNLACIEDDEVGMWHGRYRNHVTGSFPQFIHAAAHTWNLIPKELYCES